MTCTNSEKQENNYPNISYGEWRIYLNDYRHNRTLTEKLINNNNNNKNNE